MCFRSFVFVLAGLVAGLMNPVSAFGGAFEPVFEGVEPVVRVVSRDPGVLEVRLPAGDDGAAFEVRRRGRDGEPGFPLRADAAHTGWLSARVTVPEGVVAGASGLELWGRGGGGWAMAGPVVVPEEEAGSAAPDWAKGVVWYQVFPERFRNGNPDNDPYAWDRTVLAWDAPSHETTPEEVEMLWNRRVVEPRFFSNHPGQWWGGVGQVIFQRRYGGDLQGVVAQLDHIAGLGATGLYLCPVFEARSLHKYEASDHRHVDPTLGHPGTPGPVDRSGEDPLDETTWGWEPADRYLVDVLLPEARERGLRVILDGVWNHVGTDHFAFRDVVEKGKDSVYADWFKAEFDEEGRLLRYEAWDRPNGALPEFRQTAQGDLAPGPKAHVFAVTRRWMDPDGDGDPIDGVDGWRLDVAPDIGRAFWREWRAFVRSINPDAVLVGEIWTDAALWFDGVAFDAQMNYPLTGVIADWLAIGQGTTDGVAFAARANAVFHHQPRHTLTQMTLITSHDTERGASLMQNGFARAYDSGATPWSPGSAYDAGPAGLDAKRRLLAAYALLVVLPGSPMVYNGDEFALPGADDPDNRRPIPWPDLGEHPDAPDEGFARTVGRLLALRGHGEVGALLRFGSVEVAAGAGDAVVVRRVLDNQMVEAVVGRSGELAFPETPPNWLVMDEIGVEAGDPMLDGVVRLRVLGHLGVR